uniref:non-specific serine/threonine protein kinase n=1 Tax=Oryza glumipatula TaxID=40148 RepID=A0A0E0A3K6_9ORYZ
MGAGRSVPARGRDSESSSRKTKAAASSSSTAGCWGRLPLLISSGGIMTSSPPDRSPPYLQTTAEPTLYAGTTNNSYKPFLPEEAFSGSISPSLVAADFQLRQFTYADLQRATGYFRPETFLGVGGFGRAYKGWIQVNETAHGKPRTGIPIAVKTLNCDGLQGHDEWVAEIHYLRNLKHPHLVKLIGFCMEGDQRQLVYEFMSRGSLENHLFIRSRTPLPWFLRVKIVLGAAKGLAFLHEQEMPVIFRDFKTSNILLDEDFNAKLSDFGFARDGPVGDMAHVSTRVLGTYGYAAPEYVLTGHLTSMSDVYSFGVVLLEVLSGRKAMERNLVEWAHNNANDRSIHRLIDPGLGSNFSMAGAQILARTARSCTRQNPRDRPLMSEVVHTLETLHTDQRANATTSYSYSQSQPPSPSANPSPSRSPMRSSASSPYGAPYPYGGIGGHASPLRHGTRRAMA